MIHSLLQELLFRIDRLLDAIALGNLDARVDGHFHQITVNGLQQLKHKISNTLSDSGWKIPGTEANFYSDYQRCSEALSHLEHYGVQSLLQFGDAELYFCRLVKLFFSEAKIPALAPMVTSIATSSNYFWAYSSLNLIGVPPGEEAHLTNLPDLIHETGHLLLGYYEVD